MNTKHKATWKDAVANIQVSDELIYQNFYRRNEIIFYKINKELPTTLEFRIPKTNMEGLMRKIIAEFKLKSEQCLYEYSYNLNKKAHQVEQCSFIIERNLFLSMDFTLQRNIVVFYNGATDGDAIRKIKKMAKESGLSIPTNQAYLVVLNHGGLDLKEFVISPPDPKKMMLNYNDDFIAVDKIIKQRLKDEDGKGLVLLHGIPGSGKTTYIRHLISILRKKVIYFPPDSAYMLGTPQGMQFLSHHTGSIIILEDSEDLIQERSKSDNAAVSNLLNLTDGILGDCLRIQVICTFNAKLTAIDKALVRSGRLIARYEFKELEEAKCKALFKELRIIAPVNGKMTLSDIYHYGERDFKAGLSPKAVGFNFAK